MSKVSKVKIGVESLEVREVPATLVALSGGVLAVTGDSTANIIQVSSVNNGSTIQVQYSDGNGALVTQNFQAAAVQSLSVSGGDGDDYIANLTWLPGMLSGGGGNDYLQGGSGNDTLNGGDGNDIAIDNTGGTNTFIGGGGDDTLSSTVAGATMSGGDGNDLLYDIIGNSKFDGGNGTDLIISTAVDPVAGGEQLVKFGSTTAPVMVIGDVLYINGTANNDAISIDRNAGNNFVVTLNGQQTVVNPSNLRSIAVLGGNGNDTITNNTNLFMVAYGGNGNDTITGGNAFQFLKGGADNDTITVRGNNGNFISGDAGNDTLNTSGTTGTDVLAADATDTVTADGNDIITGTFLANFRGGAGVTKTTIGTTVSLTNGVLTITGDANANRVQLSTINNGATIQVQYDGPNGQLVTQLYRAASVQSILVNGNAGDDYLANLTGVNATLNGGDGNDYLQGGSGNDTLNGGNGNDIAIDNAGGINTFNGGAGDDVLSSTVAGATMNGGDGNDLLYDIIGNSKLDGGAGYDFLIGTANDPLTNGEQVVKFGSTTAPFAVIGDVLYINGTANDDNLSIDRGPNNTLVVTINGQRTTIPATGIRSIAVLGGTGNDIIANNTNLFMVAYGGNGNDIISGGSGFNFLKGGNDNDIIVARGNRAFISGDAGTDQLVTNGNGGGDIIAADPTDITQTDANDIVVGTFRANFRNGN